MKEHPILFSTPMVQAIVEGRKTMTRRLLPMTYDCENQKPSNVPLSNRWYYCDMDGDTYFNCRYGMPGDFLWVRETWKPKYIKGCLDGFKIQYPDVYPWFYLADGESESGYGSWKPSIHMSKDAARIWLEVLNVKVERLHDISQGDALKEGVEISHIDKEITVYKDYYGKLHNGNGYLRPDNSFMSLWMHINGEQSWRRNPWVWAIEFKVLSTTGKPLFKKLSDIETV